MTDDRRKMTPKETYPNEADLSETYRILAGFASDDDIQTTSRLTVSDVIRSATKSSDKFQDTLVNLFALFCTLFVGGMTLGLGIG